MCHPLSLPLPLPAGESDVSAALQTGHSWPSGAALGCPGESSLLILARGQNCDAKISRGQNCDANCAKSLLQLLMTRVRPPAEAAQMPSGGVEENPMGGIS